MFVVRGLLAAALTLALTATVSAAPTTSGKTSGQHNRSRHAIEGIVVGVHHARTPRGSGWIKVRVGQRHRRYGKTSTAIAALGKKRSSPSQHHGTTVMVNSSTRFERIGANGKGKTQVTRTTFRAVRTGEHVRIYPGSSTQRAAREVDILLGQSNRGSSRRANGTMGSSGSSTASNSNTNPYYRRHPLIRGRVLYRLARRWDRREDFLERHPGLTRRISSWLTRHPLIEGRVARRLDRLADHLALASAKHRPLTKALTHPISAHVVRHEVKKAIRHEVKHDVKQAIKHEVKIHQPTPPKHVAAKPTPPKHTPTHVKPTNASTHAHSSSHTHTHAPAHGHSSSHHKK
jgi:hypothetical protein